MIDFLFVFMLTTAILWKCIVKCPSSGEFLVIPPQGTCSIHVQFMQQACVIKVGYCLTYLSMGIQCHERN